MTFQSGPTQGSCADEPQILLRWDDAGLSWIANHSTAQNQTCSSSQFLSWDTITFTCDDGGSFSDTEIGGGCSIRTLTFTPAECES